MNQIQLYTKTLKLVPPMLPVISSSLRGKFQMLMENVLISADSFRFLDVAQDCKIIISLIWVP